MIEKKFVAEKKKEFQIREYVNNILKKAGQSDVKVKKTPLGEKIVISASRPGLVVGRKGENIKLLTTNLKRRFKLENPQVEIEEVANPNLDPKIIAERIAGTMERYGSGRFKHTGHKVLEDVMRAGALGAEIVITGKVPSARAKRWRFYQGYLKKSGFVSQAEVKKAYTTANLKTGTVGIQVLILPLDVVLPDSVELRNDLVVETKEESTEEESTQEVTEESSTEEATEEAPIEESPAEAASKSPTEEVTEEAPAEEASESPAEDTKAKEELEEASEESDNTTEEQNESK